MINYLFWIISSGITIYLLLYSRGFYLKVFSFLLRDFYLINVIDKFLFIALSFIALGFIVYLENFYKKNKKVFYKFLLITGIQLIILFVFQFTPYVLFGIVLSYKEIFFLILELILGGFFIGIYISNQRYRIL